MTRRWIPAAAAVAVAVVAGGRPAAALDEAIGAALFRRAWVPAPSATRANDGLGPKFDARSCAACHPGGDRPGLAADRAGAPATGLVVRLARPDGSPDPIHGVQLQTQAVAGVVPEARLALRPGGDRRPRIAILALRDGPLDGETRPSPRLAPALFGAGAIEAVPEAAIRGLADPQDRDGDGISGRVSEIRDAAGRIRVGRWGFRATGVDLADQIAGAFSVDMGLSTPRHPDPHGDCTPRQTACRAAPPGAPDAAGDHEIGEAVVARLAAFLGGLERPPGASAPAPSRRGAEIYTALGCPACHAPLVGAGRVVHSDLLLHDMGAGLGDGDGSRPVDRLWRTTPLIGLGDRLERGTPLLHDGRARTLAQAIGDHGGEAAAAAARYAALPKGDRRALADHLATFR